MTWVLIAIGGAAGAVSRYALDTWVIARVGQAFPLGTMIINVSGSFALGLLAALAVERTGVAVEWRAALGVGFLGAYTTFSTWMLQTWSLVEQGAWVGVAINLAGSVLFGLVAVVAGLAVGRAL
jgi:CrcB protein